MTNSPTLLDRIFYFLKKRPFTQSLLFSFYKLNTSPVFILGNEKSGTSVIAALLGEATNKSYAIDVPSIYNQKTLEGIVKNELDLKQVIDKNAKIEFSKEIIKEPSFTWFYPLLKSIYPTAKFVFIVRDPRDNIRSMLNRMKLRGDQNTISKEEIKHLSLEWQKTLNNNWLGITSHNYIESLAKRWNKAVSLYMENQDEFVLVRYEDFQKEKEETIFKLAEELGWEINRTIKDKLNTQFQPAGDNSLSYDDFFGKENLLSIEKICQEGMCSLNYDKFEKN